MSQLSFFTCSYIFGGRSSYELHPFWDLAFYFLGHLFFYYNILLKAFLGTSALYLLTYSNVAMGVTSFILFILLTVKKQQRTCNKSRIEPVYLDGMNGFMNTFCCDFACILWMKEK